MVLAALETGGGDHGEVIAGGSAVGVSVGVVAIDETFGDVANVGSATTG